MKKVLMMFLVSCIVVFGAVAGGTEEKQAGSTDVKLFHQKVEIKDAMDAYAASYSAATDGVTVSAEVLGGGGDYAGSLKAKAQSGQMPDILVIEGQGQYDLWKDYIEDLSDQPWVSDTDLAFTQDGKIYGFPVAIEGYGLAYNADILEKAGVDPSTLTTRAAYEEAFAKIDAQKDELGLDCVVSMAASLSGGMWWCAAQHGLACYWGGGLDADDTSVIDAALAGKLDEPRFRQYAEYLQLLYRYSDKNVLTNGSYDDQVLAFASQKAAFLHQGNWVDPNLKQLNADFKMGYAPHAFLDTPEEGLYLFAPSWYVVNSQSPNKEAAKAFLTAMATTEEGQDYMVNQAGMISAFKSTTLKPEGQLSQALMEANARGGNYGVFFGMLPDGAGQNVFGPIFDLFAQNPDDIDQFVADMKTAVASLPSM
jgi:raffinose/stachyose/melibiose transport system substrate-binding protein